MFLVFCHSFSEWWNNTLIQSNNVLMEINFISWCHHPYTNRNEFHQFLFITHTPIDINSMNRNDFHQFLFITHIQISIPWIGMIFISFYSLPYTDINSMNRNDFHQFLFITHIPVPINRYQFHQFSHYSYTNPNQLHQFMFSLVYRLRSVNKNHH